MVLAIVVSFQTAHSVFSDRDLCGLSQLLTDRIRMVLVVSFQTTNSLCSDKDMYGFSQHHVDIKSSHQITTAQEELRRQRRRRRSRRRKICLATYE